MINITLPTHLLPLTPPEIFLALGVLLFWLIPTVVSFIITKVKTKNSKKKDVVWMIYVVAFCLFNAIYWPIANHVGYQLLMM